MGVFHCYVVTSSAANPSPEAAVADASYTPHPNLPPQGGKATGPSPGFIQLYVEAEVDDVSVLNYVLLAFNAKLPNLPTFGFRTEADEILVGNNLGTNEAPLHIGVDLARRLHC